MQASRLLLLLLRKAGAGWLHTQRGAPKGSHAGATRCLLWPAQFCGMGGHLQAVLHIACVVSWCNTAAGCGPSGPCLRASPAVAVLLVVRTEGCLLGCGRLDYHALGHGLIVVLDSGQVNGSTVWELGAGCKTGKFSGCHGLSDPWPPCIGPSIVCYMAWR